MKYQVITKDGRAKRAQMETVHGTIQTPVFMNLRSNFREENVYDKNQKHNFCSYPFAVPA